MNVYSLTLLKALSGCDSSSSKTEPTQKPDPVKDPSLSADDKKLNHGDEVLIYSQSPVATYAADEMTVDTSFYCTPDKIGVINEHGSACIEPQYLYSDYRNALDALAQGKAKVLPTPLSDHILLNSK